MTRGSESTPLLCPLGLSSAAPLNQVQFHGFILSPMDVNPGAHPERTRRETPLSKLKALREALLLVEEWRPVEGVPSIHADGTCGRRERMTYVSSVAETVKRGGTRIEGPSWGRRGARAAVALLVFALVLLAHGGLPGMAGNGPIAYLGEGSIRCLHDLGLGALTSWCDSLGEPVGYPLLTWGPFVVVGALFMHLPTIDSGDAYQLAVGVFDAVALTCGFLLMRRLGVGWLVALGTAGAYLLTPTVIGMRGFGGTFTGYTLLPAYVLSDLLAIEAVKRWRGRRLALAAAGYIGVKTGALFMDGYSFIGSNLVSAVLWLAWAGRARAATRWRRVAGPILFVGANLAALALYVLYIPGRGYEASPVGVFRSMGLDLVTLVAPSAFVWPAASFGFAVPFDLWGDGSNAYYNYVGFLCLGLAVLGVIHRFRDPRVAAITLAAVVALVMSFGPALKVDVEGPPPPLPGERTFKDYLMPEGIAPELPWRGLFTALPGVESMRATYRWFGVTRLALVVLAGLGVAALARGPTSRRALAVVLAAIAAAELAPNLSLLVNQYRSDHSAMEAVASEVGGDLRATTRPGERVFFLNYTGRHNDWLVNYVVPIASLRAYNAGGDKNFALAASSWPTEVRAMARPGVTANEVARAFRAGRVDAVVAPYFDLLGPWPPLPAQTAAARKVFAPIVDDPRFRTQRQRSLAVIRPPSDVGAQLPRPVRPR